MWPAAGRAGVGLPAVRPWGPSSAFAVGVWCLCRVCVSGDGDAVTDRDALAADVRDGMWACCDACRHNPAPTDESYDIADHLIAKGWTRPEVAP